MAADAATGIDARAEQKAEMPRFWWTGQPCDIEQRGQARVFARTGHFDGATGPRPQAPASRVPAPGL